MMQLILDAVLPHILEIVLAAVVGILTPALARVMAVLRERLGEEAAQMIGEQLTLVMQRAVLKETEADPGADASTRAARAASYVATNSPDLVRRLGASSNGLRDRALAELAGLGLGGGASK